MFEFGLPGFIFATQEEFLFNVFPSLNRSDKTWKTEFKNSE